MKKSCKALMTATFAAVVAMSANGGVLHTLTPTDLIYEKTVNFSEAKVVRFQWSMTASFGQYGMARVACASYVDDLKCRADLYAPLDSWSGGQSQTIAQDAVMYVPAGQHVLRWKIEKFDLWWGSLDLNVAIEDYREETLARKETLYAWGKTLSDDEVWIPGNLEYLHGKQSDQIAADSSDYEARINRALTTLLLLGENETLRDLIGRLGFTLPDFYIYEPQGEFCGLENAPASTNVLDTALPQVIAAIDGALADIEAIPEGWQGSLALSPADYSALSETVYIDKAEVAAARAVLRAFRAFAQLAQGYDFEADYLAVSNAWTTCATMENLLASVPKAGRVRDLAKLAAAKVDFRTALDCLKKTDAAITSRTDSCTHFLEYDQTSRRDIAEARTLLDKAIASLDAVEKIDFTYVATKSPSNKSHLSADALPNGFVRQVYLGAIFAGGITRDLLPSFQYGTEFSKDHDGNGDFLPIYFDTIPDSTFGGLMPDLTVDEIVKVYHGDKWWTAAGYMRDQPKMSLPVWKSLNISGTAAVDGGLSFSPNVDGYLCLYAEYDGEMYLADDDYIIHGEVCDYDIASGTRYKIEFYPYQDVEEASPLTIISIPEPLPNGGPYTEIVDGVEWTFMVSNEMAIVRCSEGFSYVGDLAVPAILGGRPVTGIAPNGFMARSNVTKITLPASINSIGDYAFFFCGAKSIVFLGDEPSQIGHMAFGQLPSGFSVCATHAADWSGVTIPGTWNGFPISYIPWYNPAVVVSADSEDGMRFDESHSVALTGGQNTTVYYTVDGTDPLTPSPSRRVYDSPFDISETTTVKFCAVDNTTCDWSEVHTVTYSLIVRLPDGGPYTETVNGIAWIFRVENGEVMFDGIDMATMGSDWTPSGRIDIPAILGDRPVSRICAFWGGSLDTIRKVTIPDSVKSIMPAAFMIPAVPLPPMFDTTTYPGFIAVDKWIVGVAMDPYTAMPAYPETVNLKTARGIAEMVPIVDNNTREVILPDSLVQITGDLGLSTGSNLRRIVIPDSVMSVSADGLPLPQMSINGNSELYDYDSFPGFVAIDGWIVQEKIALLPSYCDLSLARGIMDGFIIVAGMHPSIIGTLILPGKLKSLAHFGISDMSCDLREIYIPVGVTNMFGTLCPLAWAGKKLYLPRSVTSLGDYSWCAGLETLYLPDSLRTKMETWDATLPTPGRPIDFIRNINPSRPVEVVYYTTERYQHTMRFNANGGSVSETVQKVNRGDLPGLMPTPVREGFAFAGWTLDAAGGRAFDATKIVLSDMTLYAQWESSYRGHLNRNGALVLSEMTEEPAGAVVLPHIIDGRGPVEVVGRDLLRGATKVTSVALPSTVTTIEPSAFRECSRLESVELPDGLVEIGDNAFRECVSLRSITIPASVRRIGYFAFRDCLRLETVNLLGEAPQRDLGVFMGVPAFTTISGRIGSATAIIYAEITNSTSEITVPEGWLDEIAMAHDKPAGAASYEAAFMERFGDDLAEALKKPTGKRDLHGNPLYVWQDYVAGTDPLDEEDQFTATVTMEDGVPKIRWKPELPPAKAAMRKYTTYGATALNGEWVDVSNLSDTDRHAAGYQFFRVSVEMVR